MSRLKNQIFKLIVTKIRNIIMLYFPGKKALSQRFNFAAGILFFSFSHNFPRKVILAKPGSFLIITILILISLQG